MRALGAQLIWFADRTSWRRERGLRCLILLLCCSAANALTAWHVQADHYWPMRAVFDGDVVYDWKGWKGSVKGASVVWNPPRVGLRLNGQRDWVNLGTRPQACYVDVAYCSEGLTVALWVNIRELEQAQGWLSFGGKGCGVHLGCDENARLRVNIRSNKTQRGWELVSGRNHTLTLGTWSHVAFTWSNQSDQISLYVNGSRLDFVNSTSFNTTSSNCSADDSSCQASSPWCDWSMQVGRQLTPHDHIYSAIDLAELALWSRVVEEETILEASKQFSGITQSNSGCQASWFSHLQFCYYIIKVKKAWDDAQKSCLESYKANLISVGSQEEEDFLQRVLSTENVSSCVHLGLRANQDNSVSWQDGNVWEFNRLNYSSGNYSGHQCVERAVGGSWRFIDCNQKCMYVCKRYRDRIFRDAEFYCRAKRRDYRLAQHVLLIGRVGNEIECAMECLIYGGKCHSYNYHYVSEPTGRLHTCEINRSSHDRLPPEFLVASEGFQYCARM